MGLQALSKRELQSDFVDHGSRRRHKSGRQSATAFRRDISRLLAPSRHEFMHQQPLWLAFWGQWFISMAAVLSLLYGLAMVKSDSFDTHYRILSLAVLFCSVPIYSYIHVFESRASYLSILSNLAIAWVVLLSTLFCLAFVTKTGALFSREVIIKWSILGIVVQSLTFLPIHALCHFYHRKKEKIQKTLIIGSGSLGQMLADRLSQQQGETMTGVVHHKDDDSLIAIRPCSAIGGVEDLMDIIRENDIQKVYIALPAEDMGKIDTIYVSLMDVSVDVVWVPDVTSMLLLNHSVSEMGGMPVIHLNESPLTSNPSSALVKYAMDFLLAFLGLIALSPVMISVALAVKFSSPGPVLFKQARHGWNGKVFQLYKFRSMRQHDDNSVTQATRGDSRVTAVGRFIRRTSIDELPQLFNVLKGDMSLVGPRPHAVAHNDYYSGKIRAYMSRHRIKPGITGLAQINGARGETETIDKMENRVRLDLEYINQWSLWRDIKILIKTPFVLLSPDVY